MLYASSVLTFDEHQLDGQDQSSMGCCMTAPPVYSDCQGFSHAAHMSALCLEPPTGLCWNMSPGVPFQHSKPNRAEGRHEGLCNRHTSQTYLYACTTSQSQHCFCCCCFCCCCCMKTALFHPPPTPASPEHLHELYLLWQVK